MAEGKKSFLLYTDVIKTFEHLSVEQRGQVIWWVLEYVNDKDPEPLDGLLAAVVEPIKQQLKRDLKKYEQRANRSRENGKKGGRPKNPENPAGFLGNPEKPRKPDTDTVTVTVTDNVTVTDTETVKKQPKGIMSRKQIFASSLEPYLEKYGKEMLNEFYHYWTEHNDNGKKMRFEYAKNQPFNIGRRLGTWAKNNIEKPIQGKGTKKRGEGVDEDYIQELYNRINNSDE